MFNKKVIQIVAIVMAVLMLLGIFGAIIPAFAAEYVSSYDEIPFTGQPSSVIPFIIGGIALVAAVICVILSKKEKKSSSENIDADYIKEDDVERGLNFFQSKKEDFYFEKPEENNNDE